MWMCLPELLLCGFIKVCLRVALNSPRLIFSSSLDDRFERLYADGLLVPPADESGPLDFALTLLLLEAFGSSVWPILMASVCGIIVGLVVADCDPFSAFEWDCLLEDSRLATSVGRLKCGVGSNVLERRRLDWNASGGPRSSKSPSSSS